MINAVNVAAQTVTTGSPVVFGSTKIKTGCSARHEPGTGRFTLLKPGVYTVSFNANVALATGATVTPVQLRLVQDGEAVAGSNVIYTPTAANVFENVSAEVLIRVYDCCCTNVYLANATSQSVTIQDANLVITREC